VKLRCSSRITVSSERDCSLLAGASSECPKSWVTRIVTLPPEDDPAPNPHPAASSAKTTTSRFIGP
jgi:hypothetical protein